MLLNFSEREESRKSKLANFNQSVNGLSDKGIFGLPFTEEESELIIIPVPWDVTVSYRSGTSMAPLLILEASRQIDLFKENYMNVWQKGIAMEAFPEDIKIKNDSLRKFADEIIKDIEFKPVSQVSEDKKDFYDQIKKAFEELTLRHEERSLKYLSEGRIAGILAGDHSVSLGLINALSKKFDHFSILQFDAHADLRNAFEGFEYSHASAMFNVMKNKKITKLVQVGTRDYCMEEADFIKENPDRIKIFTDRFISERLFNGQNWQSVTNEIINELEENVYISFDIDGLDPSLCPNTGTPVPGGLTFNQVAYLMNELHKRNKRIIGFDLCEVNSLKADDWDSNVGMRILYELCCLTLASNY